MALIDCPECDAEISDQSAFCVKCGYPINEEALDEYGDVGSDEYVDDRHPAIREQVCNAITFSGILGGVVVGMMTTLTTGLIVAAVGFGLVFWIQRGS